MKKHTVCITAIISVFLITHVAVADTIYLKNGRSIEGLVSSEDEQCVEVNIGFGVVKFRWGEIERVVKSSPEESKALREQWDRKKQREAQERENREAEPTPVAVSRERGHIIVNALLDNKVSASLLMDTGATYVVLSNTVWKKLDKEESVKPDNLVQLTLADGKHVQARLVKLESLSVQGVEAKDVEVVVLLEDAYVGKVSDGLLGMSFLSRFNFSVDQNNGTLTLQKLK